MQAERKEHPKHNMRGNNSNGHATAPVFDAFTEEEIESIIVEREVASFESGKADERLRQRSEELGIPFASLAARVSAALAFQGKRSAMSLLQVRRNSPGASGVLQPEMALARSPRRLLQGSGETERADSGNSHSPAAKTQTGVLRKPRAPLTPDMLKDITLRFRSGATNNNIAVAYALGWQKVENLRRQLAPDAVPVYAKKGGRRSTPAPEKINANGHGGRRDTTPVEKRFTYQQQRQIASRVQTAKRNGGSVEAVAKAFGVSWNAVTKIHNKFDYKASTPGHTYAPLKPEFRKATPKTKAAAGA